MLWLLCNVFLQAYHEIYGSTCMLTVSLGFLNVKLLLLCFKYSSKNFKNCHHCCDVSKFYCPFLQHFRCLYCSRKISPVFHKKVLLWSITFSDQEDLCFCSCSPASKKQMSHFYLVCFAQWSGKPNRQNTSTSNFLFSLGLISSLFFRLYQQRIP